MEAPSPSTPPALGQVHLQAIGAVCQRHGITARDGSRLSVRSAPPPASQHTVQQAFPWPTESWAMSRGMAYY